MYPLNNPVYLEYRSHIYAHNSRADFSVSHRHRSKREAMQEGEITRLLNYHNDLRRAQGARDMIELVGSGCVNSYGQSYSVITMNSIRVIRDNGGDSRVDTMELAKTMENTLLPS